MTEETIAARARREGRWWVFTIPALTSEGPTGAEIVAMGQSRSLKELEGDVRDIVAIWQGLPSWDGAVDVVVDLPGEVSGLFFRGRVLRERGTGGGGPDRRGVEDARRVAPLIPDGIAACLPGSRRLSGPAQ